jgi:tetratricopeptide (TPR) repeat protein
MLPRLAIHTTASARVAVSAFFNAASASARDFGGSGNAAGAAVVSAVTRSTIAKTESGSFMGAYVRSSSHQRERMKTLFLPFMVSGLLLSAAALAAGDPPAAADSKDPVLEKVSAATSRQDWSAAAGVLKSALSTDPNNANYHNLYAYSLRKGANPDMNLVFKHYNEALRLDPKLKGAHEYIGEAYLMVGNVAKAKEHLGQLDKLCFFSCSEFSDLKKAIAEHEKKTASR